MRVLYLLFLSFSFLFASDVIGFSVTQKTLLPVTLLTSNSYSVDASCKQGQTFSINGTDYSCNYNNLKFQIFYDSRVNNLPDDTYILRCDSNLTSCTYKRVDPSSLFCREVISGGRYYTCTYRYSSGDATPNNSFENSYGDFKYFDGVDEASCNVDSLNSSLISSNLGFVVIKANYVFGKCYGQSVPYCEDNAPPLIESDGSYTCDRTCESVGFVASQDTDGNLVCVRSSNDSNSTNNDSNSSNSDSNSTSNDSNATNPNDDDLNICGTMTINLVQNASLIDSYTLSGSVSDPFPKISHCSHFSLWNTSNLQHSFRANECSGYCILGYDFNSSGSVTGKNGENNITIDVSSLIQAIKNNSNTISGKIDETNSKLDGIVSSIDGVASSLAGANDKLDSIQQAINGSSNFIVAAINDVGSKIDTSNSHLASIDSKLDVTNSHLKDIKDSLYVDNAPDISAELSDFESIVNSISEQYLDFFSNVKSDLLNIQNKFLQTQELFNSDKQISFPSGNISNCFSIDIWGKHIEFDLCSPLNTLSPIFFFIISTILNFYLVLFMIKNVGRD